jgi:large subunit ribosomal protein L31
MKSDIHPEYRQVVFQDTSAGTSFLTRSTISTRETTTWDDGNEYPLAKVEISSESHPFFTGQMKIVDTAGRVERFEKRYGRRKQSAGAAPVSEPASDEAEGDVVTDD